MNVINDRYELIFGDAIQSMKNIKSGTIDFICTDLPYGTTKNKWDIIIPLEDMWNEFNRIIKQNGAIALTAAQPFTSQLVMSNIKNFKYDLVWEKTVSSGQLNIKYQPLRSHESILIFYQKTPTYNEQKTSGKPYSINRKAEYEDNGYNKQTASSKNNDGYRHARSVIKISNPRIKDGHKTQKPVDLISYLVKTFTNPGELVLDCCIGSGTTGESCLETGRKFIGIENDIKSFNKAVKRMENL